MMTDRSMGNAQSVFELGEKLADLERERNRLHSALTRLTKAISARMSEDEPTGEERLELIRAFWEANGILTPNMNSPEAKSE
jgi:hypothetical protein